MIKFSHLIEAFIAGAIVASSIFVGFYKLQCDINDLETKLIGVIEQKEEDSMTRDLELLQGQRSSPLMIP